MFTTNPGKKIVAKNSRKNNETTKQTKINTSERKMQRIIIRMRVQTIMTMIRRRRRRKIRRKTNKKKKKKKDKKIIKKKHKKEKKNKKKKKTEEETKT